MDYEKKKQELSAKFENKKNNFLNLLFSQIDSLRADLNDLSQQYKELEVEEKELKKTKKKK